MTMFCGRCGTPTKPGARFCATCGATVVLAHEQLPGPLPVRRRPSGKRLALTGVIASGVAAALVAGWAVHLLPTGSTEAHGVGSARAAEQLDAGEGADAAEGEAAGGDGDDATTTFRTACGEVLDIVPTAAVAVDTAVQITFEVHPVCPTGESIGSGRFHVVLHGSTGDTIANGTFDLSSNPLVVPGFSDPGSEFVASFGPGTAWLAPDSMAADISDGVVLVECEALDGTESTPVEDAVTEPSTTEAAADPDAIDEDTETALAALQRQALLDDPAVSELEGAWVAQLSSKKDGTYDDHDGRTYSLADIYQQFLALRLEYPNVLLLSSTDWQSYLLDGYWVVIAGVPYKRPGQPNRWCTDRGIAPSQCFAKQLVRDGAPTGTTKHRD